MRRRKLSWREEGTHEINLTPMLDVVFIMLIFFVVTASFVRETGIDAITSDSEAESVQTADAILIVIDANDTVLIDDRRIDMAAVGANLRRAVAQDPAKPVVIAPQPSSTTNALVAVMDSARKAGVENVSIGRESPARHTR